MERVQENTPGSPFRVGRKGTSRKKRRKKQRYQLQATGRWRSFPWEAYMRLPISMASLNHLSRIQRLALLPRVKRFQRLCELRGIQYKTSLYTTEPMPPSEHKEKSIHRVTSFYQTDGSQSNLPLSGIASGPKRAGCSTALPSSKDPVEPARISPHTHPTGSLTPSRRIVGSPCLAQQRIRGVLLETCPRSTSKTMQEELGLPGLDLGTAACKEGTKKSIRDDWQLFPYPAKSTTGPAPDLSRLAERIKALVLEPEGTGQDTQAHTQTARLSPNGAQQDCPG